MYNIDAQRKIKAKLNNFLRDPLMRLSLLYFKTVMTRDKWITRYINIHAHAHRGSERDY